jgi:hypothetical protein
MNKEQYLHDKLSQTELYEKYAGKWIAQESSVMGEHIICVAESIDEVYTLADQCGWTNPAVYRLPNIEPHIPKVRPARKWVVNEC